MLSTKLILSNPTQRVGMKQKEDTDIFRDRNAEIGRILTLARQTQKRTVTECAQRISTSRRRYVAIEKGEIPLYVPELEALMEFLAVPASAIWKSLGATVERRRITVQAQPGEEVELIVAVQEPH
jgi:hypothetical protein